MLLPGMEGKEEVHTLFLCSAASWRHGHHGGDSARSYFRSDGDKASLDLRLRTAADSPTLRRRLRGRDGSVTGWDRQRVTPALGVCRSRCGVGGGAPVAAPRRAELRGWGSSARGAAGRRCRDPVSGEGTTVSKVPASSLWRTPWLAAGHAERWRTLSLWCCVRLGQRRCLTLPLGEHAPVFCASLGLFSIVLCVLVGRRNETQHLGAWGTAGAVVIVLLLYDLARSRRKESHQNLFSCSPAPTVGQRLSWR